MFHLPHFITDLTIILISASVISIIFKLIHFPTVMSYILAGFLVSPYFPFFHTIVDIETIKLWSEMGVIFFLFALGLEFSLKKLFSMGKTPFIIGFCEIPLMFMTGYLFGKLNNMPLMDCLFLGGMISISSTAIILKTFNELELKSKPFAQNVFGVLIIEDIMAILLIVLLSTVALTRTFSGDELIFSSLKILSFLVIFFLLGIFLIPGILKKLDRYLTNELLLIFSLALCFSMVYFATSSGLSAALGAFLMGSILADTIQGKRIDHLLIPIKDLFGAIFFVSVGMLINPKIIFDNIGIILLLSFLVIIFKILFNLVGSIIAGQSLHQSIRTGFSLAQIGEFSFIIATLGLNLKVINEKLYPIAVSVSVITTFLTPILIKNSPLFAQFLENHLPHFLLNFLNKHTKLQKDEGKLVASGNELTQSLKKFIPLVFIIITISSLGRKFLLPQMTSFLGKGYLASLISFLVTFILTSPFLRAIINFNLKQKNENILKIIMEMIFLMILVTILVTSFFYGPISIILSFLVTIISLAFFANNLKLIYSFFENHFMENWNTESTENSKAKLHHKKHSILPPWNAQLEYFTIPPFSQFVGKSLNDLKLREHYEVMVTLIERNENLIVAPKRETLILPFDVLGVIGNEQAMEKFKDAIHQTISNESAQITTIEKYGLFCIKIDEYSEYLHKNIRQSGIREKYQGLVVGLERDNKRTLNPDSLIELKNSDMVWIVGTKEI